MKKPEKIRGFGRYHLERLIGRGGMGEIYMARMEGPRGFRKQVCIKKILPHLAQEAEFVARFIDEANIVVSLTHGNIVPVFDMGEVDGQYFIAMEYIPGRDLRDIMKRYHAREEQMPLSLALYVITETCKGLAYAHKKNDDGGNSLNIVHRDVSPSNILLSREGVVKLTDFGIAKAVSKLGKSITGRLQGKFCYMSPEQASGKSVTFRSDIFSLGSVAYEVITGVRPFEGNSDMATLDLVREANLEPPSAHLEDLPNQLDDVLLKAMALDPEDRFEDASLLASALIDVVGIQGIAGESEMAKELERLYPLGELADGTPARGLPLDEVLGLEADRVLMGEAPTLTKTATAESLLGPREGQSELLPTPHPLVGVATPSPSPYFATPFPPNATGEALIPKTRHSLVPWLVLLMLVIGAAIVIPMVLPENVPAVPSPELNVLCFDATGEPFDGAMVFVDNVFRGRCPLTLDVTAGVHQVLAEAPLFIDAADDVTAVEGEPVSLRLVLEEAPVEIVIVVDPSTAVFSVDEGDWLSSGESLLALSGEHHVRVRAEGFEPMEFTHRFSSGEQLDLTLAQTPAQIVPEGTGSPNSEEPGGNENNHDETDPDEDEAVVVQVLTEPPGATIFLNNDSLGPSPVHLRFESERGDQTIRAELIGYQAAETSFNPRRDRRRTITLTLLEPESLCRVHIWLPAIDPGSPAIGDILINGTLHGQTAPAFLELAPGHYDIRVVNDDAGQAQSHVIDISESECPARLTFFD